jgi:AraC family transcriptional regulator
VHREHCTEQSDEETGVVKHLTSSDEVVSAYRSGVRAGALPRHCSIRGEDSPIDTILFDGTTTAIGAFRCPVEHPSFRDSGPIERPIVVFPRTSVWIRHEGASAFVADANVVTIYNRGQRYERLSISHEGDRCDWFAVSDDVARDIAAAFDPSIGDSDAPAFRFERTSSTPSLYLEQRRLTRRVARGDVDRLELEEAIVHMVSRVIGLAYRAPPRPLARRAAAARRRAETAEHAKAELLSSIDVNRSASDVAHAVGTSVFHLCRVFRAHTGRTMHDYRTELRVRAALERIGDGTLSSVANGLGFSSHSHLVRVCRRYLGETPRALRASLRVGA